MPGLRNAIDTLTFDIFGTVLDLAAGLQPRLTALLSGSSTEVDAAALWKDWRARQRLEQFQDSLLMLGHSGYLETARRALLFALRKHGLSHTESAVNGVLEGFQHLKPFPDAVQGLERLTRRFRLVALSNGDPSLVEHLAEKQIPVSFDRVISVETVGRFKPHPSVYRYASRVLARPPDRIMMVAAHSFDILGARACGFHGAYVNRYHLPYEESPLQPDLEVKDFVELAGSLGA